MSTSEEQTLQAEIAAYLRQQIEQHGSIMFREPPSPIAVPVQTIPVPRSSAPVLEPPSSDPWQSSVSVAELHSRICTCQNCPLGATRTNFVFGSGDVNADIMVVGEAPGADEDAQGLPFVGRAGQLLTKILESIELPREEVYICNILKCRPPNNRKPLVQETDECEPYLWKQIELIKPKFILALGLTAANTLLKNKESMSALRGKVHDYHGIRMIVTYHPAALLRNPEWKRSTWEDVKFLRSLYDQERA